jgi:NADP-dependent 3-hydroxy acid dehydrogenase YdfG
MAATDMAMSALPPEYKEVITPGSGMAISPESVARAIAYAINEPEDAGINEIMIRPTLQAL